jgi:RNA polymerase sigma-54 factor
LEDVATQEISDTELANEELSQETQQESEEFEVDWEAYLQDFNSSHDYTPDVGKEVRSLEATLKSETSLAEYLLWQLSLTVHDELEKEIGTYLIGNIDDDGYLQCQTEEVATVLGCDEAQICAVLKVIQAFDPSGIGACNLQESLLIQLHHLEMHDSLASKIVQQCLSQLDERYFQKIAKSFGVTINEVVAAVGLIRTLDP